MPRLNLYIIFLAAYQLVSLSSLSGSMPKKPCVLPVELFLFPRIDVEKFGLYMDCAVKEPALKAVRFGVSQFIKALHESGSRCCYWQLRGANNK